MSKFVVVILSAALSVGGITGASAKAKHHRYQHSDVSMKKNNSTNNPTPTRTIQPGPVLNAAVAVQAINAITPEANCSAGDRPAADRPRVVFHFF